MPSNFKPKYKLVDPSSQIMNEPVEMFDFANPPMDPTELSLELTRHMNHFKGVGQPVRVELEARCSERICNELLHLRHQVLDHVDFQVGVELIEVPLKVPVAHLVAILVLPEVVGLLLNGIIGQVDELVSQVTQVEFTAASPDVSILVGQLWWHP